MTFSRTRALAPMLFFFALGACAHGKQQTKTAVEAPVGLASDSIQAGGERCQAKAGREVSEYDTSGDGRPDVRKVFLAIDTGGEARLVLICRETDINGDGKKDVIRYYDDEGRTLREESDRDFDGKMDLVLVFQDGKIMREELDDNHDGKVDAKIFLENGKPVRAERDLAGRSTASHWQPDRWEYFEGGRMVRMGTDLDGDSRVDRWDRDAKLQEQVEKEQQQEQQEEGQSASDGAPQSDAETGKSPSSADSGPTGKPPGKPLAAKSAP